MRRSQSTARSGFSLLEVLLVASILGMLARALISSSDSFGKLTSTGNVQASLQEQGERTLTAVIGDLKRSGFVTIGGKNFPYVFTDGAAEDPFTLHAHEPAASEAEAGDLDFGPNREIVFALPADADNDGRPDLDVDGLLWSDDEISYIVVTRPDGRNYLERQVNGGAPRRVAHDIERIVFDDHTSSGLELPMDTVRVRVFLRTRDSMGALYYDRREVVVRLRNGSEVDLEDDV